MRIKRRLILVAALASTSLLAAFLLNRPTVADNTSTVKVEVQPGDTLWDIAQRVAPDRDTREVIWIIRRINHKMDDPTIYPGEILQVPRGVTK